MWIFGIGIIDTVYSYNYIYKGFPMVYFCILFIHYGWNGFLFSVLSCLPQCIVLIPVMIFISAASMNFAISNYKNSQKYSKEKGGKWAEYGLVLSIGLLSVILTGFIETYISPLFMKMIMHEMISNIAK